METTVTITADRRATAEQVEQHRREVYEFAEKLRLRREEALAFEARRHEPENIADPRAFQAYQHFAWRDVEALKAALERAERRFARAWLSHVLPVGTVRPASTWLHDHHAGHYPY